MWHSHVTMEAPPFWKLMYCCKLVIFFAVCLCQEVNSLKPEWVYRREKKSIHYWPSSSFLFEAQALTCRSQPSSPFTSAGCITVTCTPWSRLSCQSRGCCYVLGCWFCMIGAMWPLPGWNPINECEGLECVGVLFWGGCDRRSDGNGQKLGMSPRPQWTSVCCLSPGPGGGCHIHPRWHEPERGEKKKKNWERLAK